MLKYSHVIWDWNGTLLDDLYWCFETINKLLKKRDLKQLQDITDYHRVFCFPIIEYYKNVGFDFDIEPFEVLAEEYMMFYHADNTGNSPLHKNAELVLKELNGLG